jgi:predicted nicotinamide N-methyase
MFIKFVFMIQIMQCDAMSSAKTTAVFVLRDVKVGVAACGSWISQDVDRYSMQAVNYTARDNEYQVEAKGHDANYVSAPVMTLLAENIGPCS